PGSFSKRLHGWGSDLAGCHRGGATVSDAAATKSTPPTVLSLAQLLEQQPSTAPASLVEPGLLPPQGILFVGGEPKVGKSLLVANLALSLAAGVDRPGFSIPAPQPGGSGTRAMAALGQSRLRLREASRAALVVVHHVRKSIGRHEIGSAFRGSSALHAVGDSYLLLTRPAPQLATIELRFQFRYAASLPPRLLQLDPRTLWFSSTDKQPAVAAARRKVEKADITQALADVGDKVRYNQLRDQIMNATECSKRTAQLAISEACQQGWIARANGQYHLPL